MYRNSNRWRSSSRGRSAPKPRMLSPAQDAANFKRFQEAPFTTEGRFRRDLLVTDGREVYRIVTHGIRYHEDVDLRLYGATKARAPKEWTATMFVRECIERVLKEGTHEPRSRGGNKKKRADMPVNSPAELRWEDGQPNSMASFPYLTLHGEYVLATQPNSDDAPSVAWKQDAKLCEKIREAAAIAPTPYHLPTASVRPREKKSEE